MKVKKFDRPTVKKIHEELDAVLKQFAKDHNIQFEPAGVSFDRAGTNFRTTVKFNVAEIDGVNFEQAEWNKYCELFGLEPKDFGRIINLNGTEYKLTGIDLNKRKYPILATRMDSGRSYKLGATSVSYAIQMNG